MKKFICFVVLNLTVVCIAQCTTPSNLALSNQLTTAELNWTDSGSAYSWELDVYPDYLIDPQFTPTPSAFSIATTFIYSGLTTGLCYAFFVRSRCAPNDVSQWTAIGSSGCATNVYNYLATLSSDNFSVFKTNDITIYPNPTTSIINIDSSSNLKNISITDLQGRLILEQTLNQNKAIFDVSTYSNGIYILKIDTENGSKIHKILKE